MNDNIEYLLVLSLAPFGCLQDWLLENTCSFSVFAKMAKSVARGVSHLHTEMKKDEILKPCICHRDINTRNILVKADLSCCLADFGFALKAYGPRYEWKGEIALAETKSINEVVFQQKVTLNCNLKAYSFFVGRNITIYGTRSTGRCRKFARLRNGT